MKIISEVIMRFIILMLLLAGCSGPRYADFFPYHDDGTIKPKVEFLPLMPIEESDKELAEYIQGIMLWDAMDSGELFVCSTAAEFIVKVELLADQIVPSGFRRAQVIKLRLQIIDNRYDKTILYEVMERSHTLPNPDDPRWDKQCLYSTIAKDAFLRIEEVILWTK